ncbi:DUF4249 domain-containing protein [Fulvivirgaceae bacterium BMA12]|uniref:DUF4249 domain-containing protein n=1 Tax=Agaribacillus aureus TaxID=3051825 RepID=A0ABT8L998_9BACT|nr:DUF4249 domain-containing protein [Fulvivirgaceae bacterium BMA12]
MKKLLVIIFMVCWGCETVVDPGIEPDDASLVLNSIINPDSVIKVNLSKSWYVLLDEREQFIEGATIDIYEEDKYLGQLDHDGFGVYTNSNLVPKKGGNYRIEVSKEGYEDIFSEATIPQRPALISKIKIDTILSDGIKRLKFKVEIDDRVGEDYYEFIIFGYNRNYEFNEETGTYLLIDSVNIPIWSETEDLIIDEFQREGTNLDYVFSDNFFEGKKYSLSIDPGIFIYDTSTPQFTTVTVVLRNVNKDYFLYKRSRLLQDWVDGDPFAEPVLVHNNIQNGFGIFAGYNQTEEVITVR